MDLPPIFVVCDWDLSSNPSTQKVLLDEFRAACTEPWASGAVVKAFMTDMLARNPVPLQASLKAMRAGMKVHGAIFPLPCPAGVEAVTVNGEERPLPWPAAWLADYQEACEFFVETVEDADFEMEGMRITTSIPSISPGGAVIGWAGGHAAGPTWAAAGWRPGLVTQALAAAIAAQGALVPSLTLGMFDPHVGMQIDDSGAIDPQLRPVDFSNALFDAGYAARGDASLNPIELVLTTAPVQSFVLKAAARNGCGYAVQLATGDGATTETMTAWAKNALGLAPAPMRIEVHQAPTQIAAMAAAIAATA
jgi:hypothetical protein